MRTDEPSRQAIADLVYRYAECVDAADSFARRDGRWRFAERRITLDPAGDLTHHLRRPDLLPPPAA